LKAWEGVLTVTIWTLVALHILGWLPWVEELLDDYALNFGKLRISLLNVVSFVLSIAVMLLVALWLANAIRNRVASSRVLDDSMKVALSKLVKFMLLTLAVLAAMMAAGIDITAFAVFGGALGVGLGLGLQRVVSNFVSGFILVFEGSIRPGDVISFGNTFGTVRALHTRHIVIHTRDGMDILVPNENLMTSEITNWSYEGDRKIRLRCRYRPVITTIRNKSSCGSAHRDGTQPCAEGSRARGRTDRFRGQWRESGIACVDRRSRPRRRRALRSVPAYLEGFQNRGYYPALSAARSLYQGISGLGNFPC
jgi:hypothetical protein